MTLLLAIDVLVRRKRRDRMADEKQFVPTGVLGLDHVLMGGFLREGFYLVQGDPGSGKTTLALQYVLGRKAAGERSLYISLTESRRDLENTCRSHGFALDGVEIATSRVRRPTWPASRNPPFSTPRKRNSGRPPRPSSLPSRRPSRSTSSSMAFRRCACSLATPSSTAAS